MSGDPSVDGYRRALNEIAAGAWRYWWVAATFLIIFAGPRS